MAGTESGSNDWCLIESDPGVFTELLEQLGCQHVEFQELYSLEDDALEELQNTTNAVYGLIFLFQWKADTQKQHAGNAMDDIPPNVWCAHQVTTNACATQAILSVLFNAANDGKLNDTELGDTLSTFRTFTQDFPPDLKGVAVSGSEEIKKAHNSFAPQESFLHEGKYYDKTDKTQQEAFHFVAYVPVSDTVYELDGLQKGPILVGPTTTTSTTTEEEGGDDTNSNNKSNNNNNSNWLRTARGAIQDRMKSVGADSGHVKFNLMAVIQDKRMHPAADIDHETQKRIIYKNENERRRHNYVPLAIQLLKEFARNNNQLNDLIKVAQEKQRVKRADAALGKKQET